MPVPVGVKVTVQLDVVALRPARVHGEPVKDPVAVPVLVNVTVPAGAEAVPVEISLTKPVQLAACEITTAVGVHVTAVVVARSVTVTVLLAVGPLPKWLVSDAV